MLQPKAGYIDARPLTTTSTKSSCYGRTIHWVTNNVGFATRRFDEKAQGTPRASRKSECGPSGLGATLLRFAGQQRRSQSYASRVRLASGRLNRVWVHDVWVDDLTRRFGAMDS